MKQITPAELADWLGKKGRAGPVLLDVREPWEVQTCSIAGSRHVPMREIPARKRPRAVVLASTLTSVPDLGAQVYPFLPVRFLSRFSYDALAAVKAIKSPLLVAHSREDDIIPYTHGRALYQAANEPKQFLELSGGHNDGFLFVRQEWVAELAAFLDRAAAGK